MAYDQVFRYIVLAGIVLVLVGVALFLWWGARPPEGGKPDGDRR